MNQVVFNSGGMPLHIETLAYMQTALREFAGIVRSLLPTFVDRCVLWGCEVTATPNGGAIDYTWTEGQTYYQGEIYNVAAGALLGQPPAALVHFMPVINDTNFVFFFDGVQRPTMQQRYMELQVVAVSTDGIIPSDTLERTISVNLVGKGVLRETPTYLSGATGTIILLKSVSSVIAFGSFSCPSPGTNVPLFNLPAGYLPSYTITAPAINKGGQPNGVFNLSGNQALVTATFTRTDAHDFNFTYFI